MVLFSVLIKIALIFFGWKRFLRYLRFLQQQDYINGRFKHWIIDNRAFDLRASAIVLGSWFFFLIVRNEFVSTLIMSAGLGAIAFFETDPRIVGKIKLTMTSRARRIFLLSLAIYFLLIVLTPSYPWPLYVVAIQLIPAILLLSNTLLSPLEKSIQRRYLNEARDKLLTLKPTVIGITGSYGKTSTKNAVGDLLAATLGPTFITPKSYNTLMGVSRVIREQLQPAHRYAVFEMGAYQKGSIAKLCELTHPTCAIVTTIGVAHIERYPDGEEGIYEAKSELPRALPKDGILILNGDNSGCRRLAKEFATNQTYLFGLSVGTLPLDCLASDIISESDGTRFTISWRGKKYSAKTFLKGETSILNLLAAFTLTCALGGDPEYTAVALASVKPVKNRLEVRRSGDILIIDDAFNSNPVGFRDALRVLKDTPGKRKLLMTPGMVELGPRQYDENKKVVSEATAFIDIAIVVGETNRQALKDGLTESNIKSGFQLIEVSSRDEAFTRLGEIQQKGDVLLIENDLPDVYEIRERF